jgi:glycosyltransferase involved in cell wall biosynthesis
MARVLAETNRVFYVNHPYTLRDVWKGLREGDPFLRKRLPAMISGNIRYETLDGFPPEFVAIQPPVTLPINWLPKGLIYNYFQKINNGIVLRAIRRVLKEQNIKDYIFINCYDPYYAGYLPESFGASLCLYHCIDDTSQNPYSDKHGTELEREAARKADVTLVTSTNLYKLMEPYARKVVPYYNAADATVFQKVITETFSRPEELSGHHGQVIGFVGNLDELRIDYPLLKKIAENFPDKTLLLVGPVNSNEPAAIGLDQLPNVVFAGSKPLAKLPPYLQHMDCVLIPFRCNTLTRSIYPLKINEYLAAGKPVVSTSFSDDIRGFSDCIYLADDAVQFMDQIEKALSETDPSLKDQRVAVAANNTWPARINQLWKIVNSSISNK